MITYIDTSFLIKAYVPEKESPEVAGIVAGLRGDGAISRLIDVEMASALHRKLSVQDVGKVYGDYQQDRRANTYKEFGIDNRVFELAKTLAERHAGRFQLRSLDIIHLAVALHYGIGAFATYDVRLAAAVVALGLRRLP